MDDDELQRLITNSPEMIDVISNEGVSGWIDDIHVGIDQWQCFHEWEYGYLEPVLVVVDLSDYLARIHQHGASKQFIFMIWPFSWPMAHIIRLIAGKWINITDSSRVWQMGMNQVLFQAIDTNFDMVLDGRLMAW
jgi:hypothetical protein